LLNGVTALGAGSPVQNVGSASVQLNYTGSLTGAYPQVEIEGSMDGSNYAVLATINIEASPLTGNASIQGPWPYVRAVVTSVSTGGGTFTVYIQD
jgi:hypothetical protein